MSNKFCVSYFDNKDFRNDTLTVINWVKMQYKQKLFVHVISLHKQLFYTIFTGRLIR